jgi:hypothetical protein
MTLWNGLLLALLLAGLPARASAAPAPERAGRAVHHAAAPARAGKPGATGAGARRLEDIHIEGEIPVPQVLFITARDQRRFLEFQHHRYLRTSRKIGEDTALPSWIAVTGSRAAAAKE